MKTTERFYLAGEAAGWMTRTLDGGSFRTEVDFADPDGDRFTSTSIVEGIGDGSAAGAFAWGAYSYRDSSMSAPVEFTRRAHPLAGAALSRAIPSYAEQLLVDALAVEGMPILTYLRVQDSDPAAAPAKARLLRGGTELVRIPNGKVTAERIDLEVDGVIANRHWFLTSPDGQMRRVKSDWNGAQSFPEYPGD